MVHNITYLITEKTPLLYVKYPYKVVQEKGSLNKEISQRCNKVILYLYRVQI